MVYHHEENAAERALRKELMRRGLSFRQGETIAGREVDFFLPRCLLAIEVDGLFHHTREARARDRSKERVLADRGIHVLRLGNEEVLTDVRRCGDHVTDYVRTWDRNLTRAGAATGESPWREGLRAWAQRAGFGPIGERHQPPRRNRV